jgi:DnaJ-class molecular chaperone
MICPVCHGSGVKREWLSLMGGALWRDVPCEECVGGVAYCCAGEDVDMACKPTEPPPRRR